MRQTRTLTLEDEAHLIIRSLSLDYSRGASNDWHTHRWPQFLYTQSGAIRAELDGAIWIVPPHRGLWIPENTAHQLKMLSRVELRTLYCRPNLVDGWTSVRVIDVCGLLHEAILRVCNLGWLDRRDPADERLARLIIDELSTTTPMDIRLPMPTEVRARRLAFLFMENRDVQKNYAELLVHAGLSRRTAERIFTRETGVSPARWRRLVRLASGLEHLANGGRIADAAEKAGYRSQSAFSDALKKMLGISPGALKTK